MTSARGGLQRFGEAPPRVIERAVCPCECIKRAPLRRRWRLFQGDIAEESFALAHALFAESLGRVMDGQTPGSTVAFGSDVALSHAATVWARASQRAGGCQP